MHYIDRFDGDYAFLSNFYACGSVPVRIPGAGVVLAPTVEHAFQAVKTLDPSERVAVLRAQTPTLAKRAGRRVALRPGWDAMRLDVMRSCLERKFRPGSPLAERLIATGDAHLVEGNTWGDRFWGESPVGRGENHLGLLLMERRAALLA